MISASSVAKIHNAIPFWMSLGLVPVLIFAARQGGWAVLLPIVATIGLFSFLDVLLGKNLENADPETPEQNLFWYRLITLIWFPIQIVLIFGLIWYATHTTHLNITEKVLLFYGVGQVSGAIGIVYAHELIHQKNRQERWLGDLLLASVMYGHFRTEHLQVHHRYVATPLDAVTARYNEGFYHYFSRVLWQGWISAFRTERTRLARNNLPWWDAANPFWRYWSLQSGMLILAILIGGWAGLGLFMFQAFVAIGYLELTNYVEHYGLLRKPIGNGKYEPTKPHHSWNSAHRASNWLLINLQRHSDHHAHPNRRFPLLQNHVESHAPQLPFGYPIMVAVALVPPLWRRRMNPRVREWRARFYPEITDWAASKTVSSPMPR